MRKGFTLIELVVAVALLSMVLSFAGLIFNVSIDSHRTAKASAEIMRNLRAITDQLNTDFAGIQTDAPLLISFKQDPADPNQRYDQIMFFANGDFQSIQTYLGSSGNAVPHPDGEWVLKGNAARIHYAQAQFYEDGRYIEPYDDDMDEQDRMLARRQHILSASDRLKAWPNVNMSNFNFRDNEELEYDRLSLVEWNTVDGGEYDTIVRECFEPDARPLIDMESPEGPEETFHKLMCEGVGSFAIQWAYWGQDDKRFYWFPSDDPDGDGSDRDSHFDSMPDEFGVYFNIPGSINEREWYSIEDAEDKAGEDFSAFPRALKFTFRLYDSKGIIEREGEKGREFTHIVYLGG
ncbi:MAG: type II secretion system protein [Planctomycetota bacterium]|nr:MAG: type II secretion system protein [Planctomycetota bacterium]